MSRIPRAPASFDAGQAPTAPTQNAFCSIDEGDRAYAAGESSEHGASTDVDAQSATEMGTELGTEQSNEAREEDMKGHLQLSKGDQLRLKSQLSGHFDDGSATARESISAVAAAGEEQPQAIWVGNGQTELDVVNKKLKFNKGTTPAAKLEAMKAHLNDLRSVGLFLLQQRQRLRAESEAMAARVKALEGDIMEGQTYIASLQSFNTKIQEQLCNELEARQEAEKQVKEIKSEVAELWTMNTHLENHLSSTKVAAEERIQMLQNSCAEYKSDVATLKDDLQSSHQEIDRLRRESQTWQLKAERYRENSIDSFRDGDHADIPTSALEGMRVKQCEVIEGLRQELMLKTKSAELADEVADKRGQEITQLKAQIAELQQANMDAEVRIKEGDEIRKQLHNTIMELKGNIRVFCRVRPLMEREIKSGQGEESIVEFPSQGDLSNRAVTVIAPAPGGGERQPYEFTFDRVFKPCHAQCEVFTEISQLVQSALDGYKVCIFAYGQTGSGKTYTMLGDEGNEGVIPRAMEKVFDTSKKMEQQGWSFSIQASILEVYNDDYKDLLGKGKSPPNGGKHSVHHDADGTTTVTGQTLVDVAQPEKVHSLLERAKERRASEETLMNDHSSRSHMVFTLRIDGANDGTGQVVHGVLNLIDLAGSERMKVSGSEGQRLKELKDINKSLSALGDVIMALANRSDHVPYRNSKLTWLLQPSLSGDAKVLMFVNMSPVAAFVQETLCSLRFAAKVNACDIGIAHRSVKPSKDSRSLKRESLKRNSFSKSYTLGCSL